MGSVTQRKDSRTGKVRNFIKVDSTFPFPAMAPLGWVALAKYRWIERYGQLLPGDVVHHLGDSLDDGIDNLLAVPRQVHPSIHNRHWKIAPSPELVAECLARYGV